MGSAPHINGPNPTYKWAQPNIHINRPNPTCKWAQNNIKVNSPNPTCKQIGSALHTNIRVKENKSVVRGLTFLIVSKKSKLNVTK